MLYVVKDGGCNFKVGVWRKSMVDEYPCWVFGVVRKACLDDLGMYLMDLLGVLANIREREE